jgi:hypothetical protein
MPIPGAGATKSLGPASARRYLRPMTMPDPSAPARPRLGFGRGLARALAFLFLVGAAAMLVVEVTRWLHTGIVLTPIGQVWATLHRESLLLLQPAVERHIHPALWSWVLQPILEAPALPVFLALGLASLWLGRRRRSPSVNPAR